MNEKDFAELAAGHALNALSPEDEHAFQTALAEHPEWTAQVRSDEAVAAFLSEGVADVAPPLTARSELLRRIATLSQTTDAGDDAGAGEPFDVRDADFAAETTAQDAASPGSDASHFAPDSTLAMPGMTPGVMPPVPEISAADAAARPAGASEDDTAEPPADTTTIQAIARRNWTRGIFALAASFVLLLGLGFGAVFISEQVNRPLEVVALDQIESAPDAQVASIALEDGGSATVHWSPEVGKTVLVSDGLPSLAPQEAFEMWFVRDGAPISAGVFTPGPDGDATALLNGAMEAGDVIAVTVEPAGGSPTGTPSTDPIIAIPTA